MNIHLDSYSSRGRKQPVRKSRRNNNTGKKILIAVIIILILGGLGVAGYFFLPKLNINLPFLKNNSNNDGTTVSTSEGKADFTETDAETGKKVKVKFNEADYINASVSKDDIYTGNLILVNSKHEYKFDKNDEDQNVEMFGKMKCGIRSSDMKINRELIEPLNNMIIDFQKKTHLKTLNIISAYRSLDTQKQLLDDKIKTDGEVKAKKLVAEPGYTEHHTGLVFDFQLFKNGKSYDYTGTGDYEWITKNCCNYGFVVRYDADKSKISGIDDEPWHFRYVGIPHAYIMYHHNMCLEEYIDYIKGFTFGSNHLVLTQDNIKYEIYYSSETTIQVPTDCDYSISGNNIDGFIVTAARTIDN